MAGVAKILRRGMATAPESFDQVADNMRELIKKRIITPMSDTSKFKIPKDAKLASGSMKQYGAAARYAQALRSAAEKQKAIDAVTKDLAAFAAAVKSNAKLARYLEDPTITRQQKKNDLAKLSEKFNPVTASFLSVVASSGRLDIALQVIDTFNAVAKAEKGEIEIVVTTAKPMDDAVKRVIESNFKELLGGQAFRIESAVDASLIGGLVVQIGNQRLDLSVSTELQKLRVWLEGVVDLL
eukprot:tig00020800_g13743.t1